MGGSFSQERSIDLSFKVLYNQPSLSTIVPSNHRGFRLIRN
jgi:hypothetical protein